MQAKKGFTLIELMIVIAIIAIIAAIALPNLLRSRMQANESNAIAALKSYGTAQVNFQTAKQGRLLVNTALTSGPNGYADNFRNLTYGQPAVTAGGAVAADPNNFLMLINRAFGDAFAGPQRAGCAVVNPAVINAIGAAATAAPYQGYLFLEPIELAAADYSANFALLAFPQTASRTGANLYWVGQQGTVWIAPAPSNAPVATSLTDIDTAGSPSKAAIPAIWTTM